MIYGVALLSACTFLGKFLGNIIGILTGANRDIGGVGFAIVLLLLFANSKNINKIMPQNFEKGISFWKEMYIPVVIAMSASQNVVGALSGGALVIVAGVGVVFVSSLIFMIFNRFAPKENKEEFSNENN